MLQEKPLILAAYLSRATLLSAPSSISDPKAARTLLDQALSLAREITDRAAEARILWNLSLVATRYGDPDEGVWYGEQALDLARELGDSELIAFTLHDLSWAYLPLGKLQRTREVLDEARQKWFELNNKPMLADNYATLAFLEAMQGHFQESLDASEKGMEISREIKNLWGQAFNLMYMGEIYFERGEPDKAIQAMEDCLRFAMQAGFWIPLTYTRADLAVVYASLGIAHKAHELFKEIQEQTRTLPHWEQAWLLSSLARVKAYMGEREQAEELLPMIEIRDGNNVEQVFYISIWIEISLMKKDYSEVLSLTDQMLGLAQMGIRVFLPQTLYFKGKALLDLERFDEAREVLHQAYSEMEKANIRRTLWPTLTALAELEARQGNHVKAHEHHQKAVQVIDYIADRAALAHSALGISGEELRASFLNLPEVKTALAFHFGTNP
jgi:tetratricopeptide (TPR) repeat protein